MPFVDIRDKIAFRSDKMNKVSVFDVPQMFMDVYCLEPGQAQKPHTHAGAAKTYFVIEGEGVFLVGTEERRLGPGYAVLAPEGEDHGVRNEGTDRLVVLVSMAPNPNFS